MLDLTKVAGQIQGLSQHLSQEADAGRQRIQRAQRLWTEASRQQPEAVQQLRQWGDRLNFTAAEPIEPLPTVVDVAATSSHHTVLATDGSQIAPSHHEIAYCYLINVGRVALHYGQGRTALLDSLPELFYRSEDLYHCRQWGIPTEEWMGFRRTVLEAETLAELASQRLTNPQPPTLAMVDGSLIYWFLDTLPKDAGHSILTPVLAAWQQLEQLRIPLVGYVSASRSGESLNFLRLQCCPYLAPDCLTHCPDPSVRPPCQVLEPLRDVVFWASVLQAGQRSCLWRSSAPVLSNYGSHTIYFCYIHVGVEVARLEFPSWVVEDVQLLKTALSLTLAQVIKGFGYPVALAEAHNQAVVRGGDRSRFFALLEQQMIKAGLQNIGTSYKEARKRGSIA